jgi:hypothetical protein
MNSQLCQDSNGNTSSMRVMQLAMMAAIITYWGYAVFKSGTFVDMPAGVLSVVFMLLTAKVAQKYVEDVASPKKDSNG